MTESTPNHDAAQDGHVDQQRASITTATTAGRRRLSARRRRLQLPILMLAVAGLLFAGGYAWATRARWMRLFNPLYGDPFYEAYRRYDLASATVPKRLIFVGNPEKDGIPTLTEPAFLPADAAEFMQADDRVIGIVIEEQARAYPLKILEWHEAVNDRIGGSPVAVTYCPLCASAVVFDRQTKAGEIELGVSGLLYNSNVLYYDRTDQGDESLWSQMRADSILGPRARETLTTLPLELTTWEDWLDRHPETQVLSAATGHKRSYHGPSPYRDYFEGFLPVPMFEVEPLASGDRLEAQDRVLGVWADQAALAVPVSAFTKDAPERAEVAISGRQLTLEYRPQADSIRVLRADDGVEWMYAYWFAWYAFHPETKVYTHKSALTPAPQTTSAAD